jgi:hypothetical protein
MNEQEMKRALGILIDAMASAAFEAHSLDGAECQELLLKAGLTFVRPATEEDIENSEFSEFVEPGDDWHELTQVAIECRNVARPPKATETPPPAG